MYPVITISREVGSGGSVIGRKVAEKLDIPFLDRKFIEEISKNTGLKADEAEQKGEFVSAIEKYFSSSFYNGLYLGDVQDKVYEIQKKIILEQAEKGPCVIVGRCSDFILQKAGIPCLNVFIRADKEYRRTYFEDYYGKQQEPVEKIIAKKDKGRRQYYRYYTDREFGNVNNYQLCLDCGYLGEDMCVDMIIKAAKAKKGE